MHVCMFYLCLRVCGLLSQRLCGQDGMIVSIYIYMHIYVCVYSMHACIYVPCMFHVCSMYVCGCVECFCKDFLVCGRSIDRWHTLAPPGLPRASPQAQGVRVGTQVPPPDVDLARRSRPGKGKLQEVAPKARPDPLRQARPIRSIVSATRNGNHAFVAV